MKYSSLALFSLLANVVAADVNTGPLTLLEKKKREQANNKPQLNPGQLQDRVVGGTQVTDESKYKFFVEWEDAKCGASLIHDDIALSAAHCESTTNPFATRVFVNGIVSEEGTFRTIERQMGHPLYKVNNNNDYDFMLLKLHTSALVDANGNPTGAETVTLNNDRSTPEDDAKLMAVGYGLTVEGGSSTSEVLNDVEVNYVADSVCSEQYGTTTYVPELMFCAGVDGGGMDTCQGDSGGPIMDMDTGTQVGVVSYGIGCARASHNGVYARVSAVTEWIEEMVCELSEFPPEGCPAKPANSGIGNGNGKITIRLLYDQYASETALSLIHDQSGEQLYFQPYNSPNAKNGITEDIPFEGLPAGNYSLMVGDDGRDGMCCGYGRGNVTLIDNKSQNDWIWNATDFGVFIQYKFAIGTNGKVIPGYETSDYENSWELSPDPQNYPQNNDQAWPGPKPTAPKGLNINIKFDRFPEEDSWELRRRNGNSWSTVKTFNGRDDGVHNDLLSTQLEDLDEGWYELSISDSGNDGVCCQYRRGWVAVTGYLLATRRSGLVWGNNGDFGSGETMYFKMNGAGMVMQISESSPI